MSTLSEKPSTSPVEILLVEDDSADIKLTMRALERENLATNVHVARDGIEAMEFLRGEGQFQGATKPDLILLDLNMPRKDGRETLHEIKNDDDLKSIPVVIMTTSDNRIDIERSYQENANSYITKPIDMKEFHRVIETIGSYWFSIVKLPSRK